MMTKLDAIYLMKIKHYDQLGKSNNFEYDLTWANLSFEFVITTTNHNYKNLNKHDNPNMPARRENSPLVYMLSSESSKMRE